MKRFGKWFAVAAVVAVVLMASLLVLAKILITPEKVRETVLPIAKETLHRDVSLGEIEVSLFSGISLKDLVIADREGTEPFVAADRVVLRYRLWPLLFLKVEVDEVTLDTPRIRIVRKEDGSFNFSDLTGEKGETPPEKEEEKKTDASSSPIAIHVSEVAVTNGDLLFLDHALGAAEPYRYTVKEIDLTAKDISLDRSFPLILKASINGAPLIVDGEVDPKRAGGKVDVVLSGFDVVPFTPYFRDALPGTLTSMKVDLDLNAGGDAGSIFSAGKIDLQGVGLTLEAMKDAPLVGATLSVDHDMKIDLKESNCEIKALTVTFNGLPLHLKGRVDDFAAAPRIDLEASLDGFDLGKVIPALPPGLTTSVKDLTPSGVIDAVVRLSGTTSEPTKLLKEGHLTLKNVSASAAGIRPELDGRIDLAADSLTAKGLNLSVAGNEASVALAARNIFSKPVVVDASLVSQRFDADAILPPSASSSAAPKSETTERTTTVEIGPFDIPVRATGKVSIEQALYKGLSVEGLELLCSLEKNVFTLEKLTGRVAGGNFSKKATVDLARKGLAYTAHLDVENVQADPVITAFVPKAAGTVFGNLALNADISGRGTLPDTLKKNLNGKGSLLIADGKLTGAGLVKGLADFLDMEDLRVLQFSRVAGDFTVRDGKVRFDTDVSGRDARLTPKGTVGLDGSLDVALNLRLSPELSAKVDRKGKVSNYFKDEEGWGEIPLKLKGTASSPKFVLDTAALGKKAKEKASQEIQKKIEKKLFDKIAPKKEGEETDPKRQLLEDAFKGLFGQ